MVKSPHSLGDAVGVVYLTDECVYRAVNEDYVDEMRLLLDCGLVERLVDGGLVPKAEISRVVIPGYTLVVETEKISPLVYPYEWSPEMLRQAGKCVLEVNCIANEFGYELKDAHPYNLVFKGSRPLFVDLGSFKKRERGIGWTAYSDFLSGYYYPLKIYSRGFRKLYKYLFLMGGRSLPLYESARIADPVLRLIPQHWIERWFRFFLLYRNISLVTEGHINRRFRQSWLRKVVGFVSRNQWLPFNGVNLAQEKLRLGKLNWRTSTEWGDYHQRSGYVSPSGAMSLSPRLLRVLDLISGLKPATVLDLAGNQGVLSRYVARLDHVQRVMCTDIDESAIDTLFRSLHPDERVTPAVHNFMGEPFEDGGSSSHERFKSDVVVALAVTHHLILSQGYSLDSVVDRIVSYSLRYVILEFMPLGLWDGSTEPCTPLWYGEEWFERGLSKRLHLISKEVIEKNRILYLLEREAVR